MLIGLVGKPSAGKSTFFKASTLFDVDIANYPFTTIKANHAVTFVSFDCSDKFFDKQCNPREGYCVNHKRFVPVDLMDVAGLIPGAHEGLGMGNQFLDDLRQADCLIHVIDASGSTNEKGEDVEPLSHNPSKDVMFLEEELDYWYFNILKKNWDKLVRMIKQEKKEPIPFLYKQFSGLRVTENHLIETFEKLGNPDIQHFTDKELFSFARELRILSKPMIIAANKLDVEGAYDNFLNLKKDFPHLTIVPCSSVSELGLKEANKNKLIEYIPGSKDFSITEMGKNAMNEAQKNGLEYIKSNILNKFEFGTGVQEVLNTCIFKLLDYIPIYPGGVNKLSDSKGNVLPDCFLMKNGSTALDFAFRLHTDMGNGFIKAVDVKKKIPIGKDQKLNFGDVLELHFK